jgi:hypothetical protein
MHKFAQLSAIAPPVAFRVAGIVAAQIAVKVDVSTYGGEYLDSISGEYWTQIYEACYDYLTGDDSVTRARNVGRKAVVNNFSPAFYSGYADGGGEETEDDDESWLTNRISTELGFIDELFSSLRDKRKEGMTKDAADAEASTRAEGFRNTLNGVYSEGKLRGSKNRMLEFDGTDGQESCETCIELLGKRRSVRWILENDMIPRPGNTNFECNGYRCQHFWKDPKTGERYTL